MGRVVITTRDFDLQNQSDDSSVPDLMSEYQGFDESNRMTESNASIMECNDAIILQFIEGISDLYQS